MLACVPELVCLCVDIMFFCDTTSVLVILIFMMMRNAECLYALNNVWCEIHIFLCFLSQQVPSRSLCHYVVDDHSSCEIYLKRADLMFNQIILNFESSCKLIDFYTIFIYKEFKNYVLEINNICLCVIVRVPCWINYCELVCFFTCDFFFF